MAILRGPEMCPANPVLSGIKGHNTKENYLAGKPRRSGVELHIVKRRLIEERGDRLAQSIKEAREEYKRGKIRKGTVDDLMHELSK